jgi:hypothetical protein
VKAFVALGGGVDLRNSSLADSAAEDDFGKCQALRRRRVAGGFGGRHRNDATMLWEMTRCETKFSYIARKKRVSLEGTATGSRSFLVCATNGLTRLVTHRSRKLEKCNC